MYETVVWPDLQLDNAEMFMHSSDHHPGVQQTLHPLAYLT